MNEGHPQVGSPTAPSRAGTIPPPIRAASVALVAASGAGAGLALAARPLSQTRAALADGTPWDALPLDVLLSSACAVALAVCCLWLLTVTVATALEAVTGVSSAALRALTPHAVRRAVLLACGFAVSSAAVVGPAAAATEAGPGASVGANVGGSAAAVLELDGLPLPDRTVGDLRETVAPRPLATPLAMPPSARFRVATAASPGPRVRARYTVRRGDSLWSLARGLRPGGGLDEVDRTWRRVYRLNRPAIGDDPDLIIPGTTLHLPVRPTGARRLDGPARPGSLPHRKDAS